MNTRRLSSLLLTLPLIALVSYGCESNTNLDEVSLVGTWDGVGDLQTTDEGRGLTLFIQTDAGGTVSGTWTRKQDLLYQGGVSGVTSESGQINLTLRSFPGDDPTFIGELTDQHRMSGSMNVMELDGSAVFRRRSVAQP